MMGAEIPEIQLVSINDVWRYGNIGLDQLAGYLRSKGYRIKISYFGKKDTCQDILRSIDASCTIFGFSVNFSNYEKCCEIIQEIKKINTSAVTILGGGLVSRYYREILKDNPCCDYAVLGDGELPTEQLLKAIVTDAAKAFKHTSVASQFDMQDKQIQINTFVPADPAYDYYINDSHRRNSRKVHCIQTKNNICTGNCNFCTERHGRISYRDLDDVVSQVKKVYTDFGVQKIFFTDDNILDPDDVSAKLRILDLCRKIKKLNLSLAFQCYMRASSLKDTALDRELLQAMHDVGFVEVFVGVESGNQRDLDLYNKKTTVADNNRTIALLKEYAIFPILGFISFNPYSTFASISENFRFLCSNECTYLFNYIYSFVIINKYTTLYDRIHQDGLLLSPPSQYLAVDYGFAHSECNKILGYVKDVMIPRLNKFDYQLDWVTYSFLEHQIWYQQTPDYTEILQTFKREDLAVIKKYLSILFLEHDLNGFIRIAPEFWKHFQDREFALAQMYDTLVSLH